jgi:hypothetical protein
VSGNESSSVGAEGGLSSSRYAVLAIHADAQSCLFKKIFFMLVGMIAFSIFKKSFLKEFYYVHILEGSI